MEIVYVNYGFQSGVTEQVRRALEERGHRVTLLDATGPLEYRDRRTGAYRLDAPVLLSLLAAAARYGRRALDLRWATTYAFDFHSRHAGRLLEALPRRPDAVLQAGALFSPGLPPPHPYVLLLDHTQKLSLEVPRDPGSRLPPPPDRGNAWRKRETALYRKAVGIGTFSQRVVRSLCDDYGVPPGVAEAVGAGANVFPEQVRREDDGQTLVFVGTRFDIKGGPVLLRAFLRLRRRRPDLRLLVVGTTERLHLPKGAENLGYVPASRLPEIFARSTIFVLPTIREAFGLAFLDAMACGLPCVGTRVGAVPEIVEDGVTGFLAQPGDDAALAEAIERLLDDPERARAMGMAGRQRVASRWRWSMVAERLERLLARCVQAPDAPQPAAAAR